MKMNKRILCSALVLCGAFFMTAVSVSAEETTSAVTSVVTSEVISEDEISLVTTAPTESTPDEFGVDDLPEIEGVDKDDIVSVETLPVGNGTLLEDVSNDVVDRQFITVQSKNGNTFYIVIDKDNKGNKNVYFMNLVDEYDLLAFSEDFPEEVKSELGVSEEETPVVTDESGNPIETTADGESSEEDTAEKQSSGGNSFLIPILLLLAGGGGAFYYVKVYKPKQNSKPKKAAYDEDEEYEDEPDEVMVNEDNEDE